LIERRKSFRSQAAASAQAVRKIQALSMLDKLRSIVWLATIGSRLGVWRRRCGSPTIASTAQSIPVFMSWRGWNSITSASRVTAFRKSACRRRSAALCNAWGLAEE
jgi:hypothetical protein